MLYPFKDKQPQIDGTAFITPSVSIIGDVEIGAESSVWFGSVLRGDVNEIRIGKRTNIQDGTVIHVASKGQGTYIGDNVTVGHMALLHACTIESDTFIGMRATVMDGAVVQSRAMVAAGALVTAGKIVPTGELWGGQPAKKMRDLTEKEIEAISQSATHYIKVASQNRDSYGQETK